ncbi:MAG: hypothetical protein IH950_01200 [Bacteroidetes bacterium]|nr:hypothetical protein [Bacteroidota bacterium]
MNYISLIKNNLILLSILIIFLIQSTAAAGAWTQKKGRGYYKVEFRYLSATKIYDSVGVKESIPKFTDVTIGIFGSYGITDNLTTFVNINAFKTVSLDSLSSAFGSDNDVKNIGDLDIGLKYRLANFGKTVISVKLILGLPTGLSTPDGGLWTGSGNFNQLLGVEVGHSFYPLPIYLSGGIAFNNRTNGFSDEFKYIIEGGYKFTKKLSLTLRFHGVVSFKNGDPSVQGGFGIFSNNQEYIAYNAALVYKISDSFGINGYYESGTNGKNIISTPVFNIGVFFTK